MDLHRKTFNHLIVLNLFTILYTRLHSILGNTKKAENAALIALSLSKNENRYITRSVSRFFVHKKDFEQAQGIIRKAKRFKIDPWLISTDISLSQSLQRMASSFKVGREMLGC